MEKNALVFQTDFGMEDGAVSAMYGVAYGVSPDLKIYDLTHGIEPYNTWEATGRKEPYLYRWWTRVWALPGEALSSGQRPDSMW